MNNNQTIAQDQLLSLFDRGEVSLFKWRNDKEWSTAYASQNTLTLFGYTQDEFLSSTITYAQLIHKDDLQNVTIEVTSALQNDLSHFTHKPYRILTKSSEIKWVLDNTYLIKDADGEVTHFLGTISDITELRGYQLNLEKIVEQKTEENLKQKDILYRQNRFTTIGETIINIAHQWRQPLNSIGANISKLELLNIKTFKDKAIETVVNDTNNSLEYMSQTIGDFSNYFSSNKKKELFEITQAMRETLNIISPQLKNQNIELKLTNHEQTVEINAHKNELIQVVLILLNNARDAIISKKENKNFRGKIILSVSVNKESISISVEDNGGGIKAEIIDRIFEPYFTTKFKSQGTGIGLYMCKMIVEHDMNGKLEVHNLDEGTLFKIILKK